MIVRMLDGMGDWLFGKGKQDYITKNNAIAQMVQTKLSTFLGECFFNVTVGVDWWNLLGFKNQQLINLQCSTVILNIEGVTGIKAFSLGLNPINRNLNISYNVETIYPGSVAGNLIILTDQQGNILTDQQGNILLG